MDEDTAPPPDWDPADGIAAATVVLLRDAPGGVEVLLMRRNRSLRFAGGMWVFPGGRVDAQDHRADDPRPTDLAAARRAAVRETHEEAGLILDPDSLVPFSHWTPPAANPSGHRFLTWFFLAAAPDGVVRIDEGEIHDHLWIRPHAAHRRRDEGNFELAPPTWITLHVLAGAADTARALADARQRGIEYYKTRFGALAGGMAALYHGDAGYDDGDVDRPGGRHRLLLLDGGWRYERTSTPAG